MKILQMCGINLMSLKVLIILKIGQKLQTGLQMFRERMFQAMMNLTNYSLLCVVKILKLKACRTIQVVPEPPLKYMFLLWNFLYTTVMVLHMTVKKKLEIFIILLIEIQLN